MLMSTFNYESDCKVRKEKKLGKKWNYTGRTPINWERLDTCDSCGYYCDEESEC